MFFVEVWQLSDPVYSVGLHHLIKQLIAFCSIDIEDCTAFDLSIHVYFVILSGL